MNTYIKEWRKRNPEKIKGYKKKYYDAHREEQALYYKKWYQENGRKRVKVYWLKKWIINKPLFCSFCKQNNKVDGHHPEYNEPLKVVWLCKSCHKKLHNKIKSLDIWNRCGILIVQGNKHR